MAGIVEEQHPDRARLFMQWKRMDWPILVDSLNLLDVEVVPVTLAIDEYGIIRRVGIPLKEASSFSRQFVEENYEPPAEESPPPAKPPELKPPRGAGAAEWRAYGDALFLWSPDRINDAVDAYREALKRDPRDARARFRLGVAYRKRYDSGMRRADDFQSAVEQWTQALDLNPNQYIWRRRIQQYGPRLDKPYPFYDWVHTARKEILARGETPAPLVVEPGGAEYAKPLKRFETAHAVREEPDPKGKIHRDNGKFVLLETAAVPPVVSPGESARFHLVFRPNAVNKAHWNNEADGLLLWLNPSDGWALDNRSLMLPNPRKAVSQEARTIEFEAKSPAGAKPGTGGITGYALYYVCEDVNGVCLYRRQDLTLRVRVR